MSNPLIVAISHANLDLVKYMISKGADLASPGPAALDSKGRQVIVRLIFCRIIRKPYRILYVSPSLQATRQLRPLCRRELVHREEKGQEEGAHTQGRGVVIPSLDPDTDLQPFGSLKVES